MTLTLSLSERLKIRSTVLIAGEVIPYYWPMRTFIHYNPLHGLERLPFEQAVEEGARLFHARRYLPRMQYQRYLAAGKVDSAALQAELDKFLTARPALAGVDQRRLLWRLLTEIEWPVHSSTVVAADVARVLRSSHGREAVPRRQPQPPQAETWFKRLRAEMTEAHTIYDAVDQLFGTDIGEVLNELLIKGCMDFLDEGQSIWRMPGRRMGLFRAWSGVARRNLRLSLRGLNVAQVLSQADDPEDIIVYVMTTLGIPEHRWMDYFSLELAKLHGWAGFIRWRAQTKDYYWSERYPADLVDFLAIRLVLALALLQESARRRRSPLTLPDVERYIDEHPQEAFLRRELYTRRILPALAKRVEAAIESGKHLPEVFNEYMAGKTEHEAEQQARRLLALDESLNKLDEPQLTILLDTLAACEKAEGYWWLQAMESAYIRRLLQTISIRQTPPRPKPPFVQALFCIDVRAERFRRHLEVIGDYQTFGIAGFFGVPLSFIEMGKGCERHLCPVLLKPKNAVLEITPEQHHGDKNFYQHVTQVLHELKNSVLSPYFTVEAIGLLFGFDMVGKTVAPLPYNTWRRGMEAKKPMSRLLIDKLSRAQADSTIRSLQRALIVQAIKRCFKIQREAIADQMIKELRDTALGLRAGATEFCRRFGIAADAEAEFIDILRKEYRIEQHHVQLQMERLGRIGFTLDEQVHFVGRALQSIGLTQRFSRLVLLVGHGSTSENNPYESALDCGACGGDRGLTNARVFALMANSEAVRARLREQGIAIPLDTYFVPAVHDTTADEIELHDLDQLRATHLVYLERLRSDLVAASRLTAAERLKELGCTDVVKAETAHRLVRRNANDWSQVRPEWGLARNASFIIGSRDLTRALNLEGRSFLHSYDYRIDPKGRLLETILSGPLVVAQWINMEHYFSTTDNETYGSGSKIYHNVACRSGVVTGNLSDLRTGLPAQTVLWRGQPYHEPLRLITVIEAPLAFVERVIGTIFKIKTLVQNGWIRLIVIDREAASAFVLNGGQWLAQPLAADEETIAPEKVYE